MLSEIILAGIIVLLSLPIISSSVTMTPAMSMVTDAALVIAFLFSVMLIWHEHARDKGWHIQTIQSKITVDHPVGRNAALT